MYVNFQVVFHPYSECLRTVAKTPFWDDLPIYALKSLHTSAETPKQENLRMSAETPRQDNLRICAETPNVLILRRFADS